ADYRHQVLLFLNKFIIDVRIQIFWMQMYEDSCYVKTDYYIQYWFKIIWQHMKEKRDFVLSNGDYRIFQ
uniref:Uncharacterized protein n=1 Tax=Oryza brachyantha TaxID=4533 RepID=J3L076_ORYBR